MALAKNIKMISPSTWERINRVLVGWAKEEKIEKVPASQKVVSIFRPHTGIIVKDRRDTYYGP